jgi:hypothetical protein
MSRSYFKSVRKTLELLEKASKHNWQARKLLSVFAKLGRGMRRVTVCVYSKSPWRYPVSRQCLQENESGV